MINSTMPIKWNIMELICGTDKYVISAQKVLFLTLFIEGFEHFLYTNQRNLPNWHTKVSSILLIVFCG